MKVTNCKHKNKKNMWQFFSHSAGF